MVLPGVYHLLPPAADLRLTTTGQALIKGEMLDYYDISGCYILKPASYGIWQEIQSESHALYPVSCV